MGYKTVTAVCVIAEFFFIWPAHFSDVSAVRASLPKPRETDRCSWLINGKESITCRPSWTTHLVTYLMADTELMATFRASPTCKLSAPYIILTPNVAPASRSSGKPDNSITSGFGAWGQKQRSAPSLLPPSPLQLSRGSDANSPIFG